MYFYISDLHFSHKNIIGYDNRPYFTVGEMNQALIDNWNGAVKNGDTVFVLGDFHWGNKKEWIGVLEQLNGDKVLVYGNHDAVARKNEDVRKRFVECADYLEIDDDGSHVILQHFPIVAYKNMFYGWKHLYGHVHSMMEWNVVRHAIREISEYYEISPCAYNIGCMMEYMGYTPRTLKHIEEKNGKDK